MGNIDIAEVAPFGLIVAGLAYLAILLWRRRWSWLGLYVGFGCLIVSLIHLAIPAAMLVVPASEPFSAETGPITWHRGWGDGLVTSAIALAYYLAAVAAITPPRRWSAAVISLASAWMIAISAATVVNDYIVSGLPAGLEIGTELPVWLSLPLILLLITGPFVCGIPWSLLRQYGGEQGESDAILRRYWLQFGIVLVLGLAVVLGVSQAAWHADEHSGRLALLMVILLLLLMGGLALTLISIQRNFLLPAIGIIEGVRNDAPLVASRRINPLWQGLARSIEDNRQRAQDYQEQLELSRDALHRSEKLAALGQLLAGVSHELNNPLAAIIGQTSLLAEDLDGTGHADRVSKIQRAADRCARIVQSFLAMARQRPVEFRPVSFNDQVRQALELTEYQMRAANVSVEVQLDEGLPMVAADPDQLHQVIVNLLTNARQATEGSPREPRVTISTSHARGKAVLRIADNGKGIDKAARARVFDPFYTTKDTGEGTGIGLSYSLGVIEAHGGTLTLEPAAVGCTFAVTLPVTTQSPEATAGTDHEAHPGTGRVLVVDDEPELAETLADMLERMGLDPEIAIGGKAAQGLLETGRRFALVLSDIRMPDVDGPALFDWIGANRPELAGRIAFVTGDTMSTSVADFIARAGCPVLEKPFDRAALQELVEGIMA